VIYDATDFVRKNADTIPLDLVKLARTSTNPIIRSAFPPAKAESKEKRRGSTIVGNTVWTKFRGQLGDLMEDLGKTETR